MRTPRLQYSMLIEWSEEDRAYLVMLPEWADRVMMPATHGKTYRKAAKHGRQVLELLVKCALEDRQQLPKPKMHGSSS